MPTIDRNQRARLMYGAEALDRRTREPGQHGGVLKRAGLAVLKALLFQFANVATGRCDPSFDRIAEVAGVARSTVAEALNRLEAVGLVARVRRQRGTVRFSNAYVFPKSGFRAETTNPKKTKPLSARFVPAAAAHRAPAPAAPPPRPGRAALLASARRLGILPRPDPAPDGAA